MEAKETEVKVKKGRKQERFYRVRREGSSTVITVGARIPAAWEMVEIETVSESEGEVVLKFIRTGVA